MQRVGNREAIIITAFALLHAVAALACRLGGITEDVILTMLTMLMVMVLCFGRGMSVTYMGVSLIVANLAGLALGAGIAWLIQLVTCNPLIIHPIATLLTTIIVGIGVIAVAKAIKHTKVEQHEESRASRSIALLLVAFVIIICVRLAYVMTHSGESMDSVDMMVNVVVDFLFTGLAVVLLGLYALRAQNTAQQAKTSAELAQYRYLKLKQQVNPHFLFNSLNVLNYLVMEDRKEQAGTFVQKLASIYRYMIRNDERTMVSLSEEMEFASQYIDLLKVRYEDGFDVKVDVPDELMHRQVVPCSVQLLVENATKHNVVTSAKPLHVTISATDQSITVTNNLQRRNRPAESSGLGLTYISQQYESAGKSITIDETSDHYSVTLPLL